MEESKKFRRLKENFLCEVCSYNVIGNGYTNHCPKCLYSKHVDIFPGDRSETCKGLMKPIGREEHPKKGSVIHHLCERCRIRRRNKSSPFDNPQTIQALPFIF